MNVRLTFNFISCVSTELRLVFVVNISCENFLKRPNVRLIPCPASGLKQPNGSFLARSRITSSKALSAFIRSPLNSKTYFLLPEFISSSFFIFPLIAVRCGRTSFHLHRKPFSSGLATFVISATLFFFSVFPLPCSTHLHAFVARTIRVFLVWLSPTFSYPGQQKYFLLWISLAKSVSLLLKPPYCVVD